MFLFHNITSCHTYHVPNTTKSSLNRVRQCLTISNDRTDLGFLFNFFLISRLHIKEPHTSHLATKASCMSLPDLVKRHLNRMSKPIRIYLVSPQTDFSEGNKNFLWHQKCPTKETGYLKMNVLINEGKLDRCATPSMFQMPIFIVESWFIALQVYTTDIVKQNINICITQLWIQVIRQHIPRWMSGVSAAVASTIMVTGW